MARLHNLKVFFKIALTFALLVVIVATQYYFDIQKRARPMMPLNTIPAEIIKMVDLGLHSAASSLMWIYTIQQVLDYPEELPWLIQNVNKLDPKFSYPYAFGTLILPAFGMSAQAIELAKQGIGDADPDWRIPYYLATTYHIFLKDRENAALYFDMAAKTSGAPENIKIIASRYGTSKNVREQTKTIWESIYENSDDDLIKESARTHLIQIEILELLEKAVSIYKQKIGKYPENINDLVSSKILKGIPPSPFGLEFYLDTRGGVLVK
jgi:tetratricopeptide (TPR) repeat protein